MSKRPRTIQIFLPSGDPSGIRKAEITTSIIRVIEVPRAQLPEFLLMDEAKQVGIYFLIGGESQDSVYIGQSGGVGGRLLQHSKNESKDWERALVLVSMTNNLTQTHVLYLESISIEYAKKCGRYSVLNGNGGQKPYTPIPLQADCDEIHEIGSLLLATLGYPIFEPLVAKEDLNHGEPFLLTRSGASGKAFYTNEGLVVLEGSKGLLKSKTKQFEEHIKARDRLIEQGVMKIDGQETVFVKDHLFKTPSGAACVLIVSPVNGWTEWKRSDGTTLDDVYRPKNQDN